MYFIKIHRNTYDFFYLKSIYLKKYLFADKVSFRGIRFMDLFSVIVNQMGMLAIYVIIGIIGVKAKIFNRDSLDHLSKYIMKISLPIMIFTNTINGATAEEVIDTLPMLVIAVCMFLMLYLVGYVISKIFNLQGERKHVYRAVSMFGNVGFIGIPLIATIFPERGMLYIALFTIIDQGLLWTVGMKLTSPIVENEKQCIGECVKKMINPATVGILLGVAGVFAGVKLPSIVDVTLTKVGATTTPISMIYIGGLFCYADIRNFVKKAEFYLIIAFKMLVFPILLYLAISKVPFINDEIKITLALLAGLPSMSSIAMFANANGSDGDYAIGAVFITTIMSVATLPLISYIIGTVL